MITENITIATEELLILMGRIDVFLKYNQKEHDYIYIGCVAEPKLISFLIVVKKNERIPDFLTDYFFNKIDLKFKVRFDKIPRTFEYNGEIINSSQENEDIWLFSVGHYD